MNNTLNQNLFFVREQVRIFKASNAFDILDPVTNATVLECREQNLGFFTKFFRFTDYKRMTPFNMEIRTPQGEHIVTVRRGVSFFVSNVEVVDDDQRILGRFKQKFFTIGARFEVFDDSGRHLCVLRGTWSNWDFKFVSNDGKEFASVSKKWNGLGKELFTTADNYILQISNDVPSDHPLRQLILAAVMCIDLVLKE
jgi:uncharacterized protein YxjI